MISIGARYCGPPESGNGGYCSGVLAKHLRGPVEVTLRKPPPLERELRIDLSGARAELRDGDDLVAEAREVELNLDVPPPVSFDVATRLSAHYVGLRAHHFPTCFVCGPARAPGDGLRIFAGAERQGEPVASPWVASASVCDASGRVPPEIMWAALDCAGYFAVAEPDYPIALLGRMTAELLGDIGEGDRSIVMGYSLGREGRKLFAGTAVFGANGELKARARQVWIVLSGALSSRPPPLSSRSQRFSPSGA
jgi:hypothetical protein